MRREDLAPNDTATRHPASPPVTADFADCYLHPRLAQNIQVLYQPIVDLAKGKVFRVEALVRFQAEGMLVSPDRVLPFLNSNEIHQISLAVLKKAARDLRAWQGSGLDLQASINIEIGQLDNPHFCASVLQIIYDENIPPKSVVLEILEGKDQELSPEMLRQISKLKTNHISISLDDVGSAYSGLSRIKKIPADSLKLDKYFVDDLHFNPSGLNFIQSILALGHALGKKFIVEGVEDIKTLNALRRLGVSLIQGYVFFKPITAQEIPIFLCGLKIPEYRAFLEPGDWIGAYAEILHEKDRLTAMLRHAPEMLDGKNIKLPGGNLESCLLMAPYIYNLYGQQRTLIYQSISLLLSAKDDRPIERIEHGYQLLLHEIEKKICEVNDDEARA